jgi:hypothetical protein
MQMLKLKLTSYERTSRSGQQSVSFERRTTVPQYVHSLTMNRGLEFFRPTYRRSSRFGDSYHFRVEKRAPAEPRRLDFTRLLIPVTIPTHVTRAHSDWVCIQGLGAAKTLLIPRLEGARREDRESSYTQDSLGRLGNFQAMLILAWEALHGTIRTTCGRWNGAGLLINEINCKDDTTLSISTILYVSLLAHLIRPPSALD